MKLSKLIWNLAAIAVIAWPLMDATALAQRGERGGGGDRGGARSGGGDRGGGGRSFSGGQRSGGGQRSFSDGGGNRPRGSESGRSARQPGRSQVDRSFGQQGGPNRSARPDGGSERTFSPRELNRSAQPQRSFYRGPGQTDGQRSVTRDFENRQRDSQARDRGDFDRSRNQFTRERDDQFNRDEFRGRDQFNRERDDQFARERDRDRGDFDRSRGDRDRDRDWDRSNWDRDDWNRFGRGRDDWRWGRDDIGRSWWRYSNRNNLPFRYGWWDSYAGVGWPAYSPYRYSRWQNQPYYWWTWTPAARLGTSLVFGWDRPRYWGYGPGANIYYQDDYVYYDNRRTILINDYYQQVYDLAHSVPNISDAEAEQMQWNPLGVFAVHRPNESESTRAIQLAVSNDGVITGTYFNRNSNQVHPLSGMVDERTQRAAWAFADGQQKALVFETGIYNLTRDESTMMVHFGPSEKDAEVWQLVRLEQPEDAGGAIAAPETQRQLP